MFIAVLCVALVAGLVTADEKRNGLCDTKKRNTDLKCVFALLDGAKGDPQRIKEIELMLLASQDKRDVEDVVEIKRNGLCDTKKRNTDLKCVFALLDGAKGDPQRIKEIELMLLASQDKRDFEDVVEIKRNGLCDTKKRNTDLKCVFALLDGAKGDPQRIKEIELMLLASKDKRHVDEGVEEFKRNGLCESRRRNINLGCVFALLDSAKGDQARIKEIEMMLLASQD